MVGGRVTHLEVIHDTARMAAFLELARGTAAEA
jgi:hypothetical protein